MPRSSKDNIRGSRSSRRQASSPQTPLHPDDALPSIERDSDDLSDDASSGSDEVINTPTSSTSPISPARWQTQQRRQCSDKYRQGHRVHHPAGSNHNAGEDADALDLTGINAALDDVERSSHQPRRTVSSSLQPAESFNTATARPQASRLSRTPRRSLEPPHNVEDETVPNDRFNNPTFQQSLSDSQAIAVELRDVLGSSDLHRQSTSVMRRLHQESVTLAKFRASATRKVGFVGDSGVGKSSLLNSLLDVEGLARTSNEGSACTCVATEYHYHAHQNFTIEVHPFTEEEIDQQLDDLLRAYRHFHRHRNNIASSEIQDYEEKAKLAVDTFKAMFGARLGAISTATQGPAVISSLLGQNGMNVLCTLKSWAREAIASSVSSRVTLSTSAQASEELAKLTSEMPGSGQRLPWPFIKRVKVFLSASILGRGLVLIDLPGLRDMNTARRNITERYMTHSLDEIFAVCLIGRAVTDEGVKAVIDLAARAGLNNVGVICNKTDDIRAREAMGTLTGSKRTDVACKMDRLQQAQSSLSRLELELADLDDYDISPEDELALNREAEAARREVKAADFDLHRTVVNIRNRTVTNALISLYEPIVPNNTLRVFCVSSKEYWDNRKSPRSVAMPHLELSGILDLRQHCRSMVSESQYRLAFDYMQTRIPVLLGEVGLWVTSTEAGSMDAERRRMLRQGLRSLETRLRRDIEYEPSLTTLGPNMCRDLREKLMRPSELRIEAWSRGAINASRVWHGWHQASYAAFCRQYGDHITSAAGSHCWNQEAITKMIQEIMPMWQAAMLALDQRLDTVAAAVEASLISAIEFIDDELDEQLDIVLPLRSALLSMQRLLEGDILGLQDAFTRSLRLLRIEKLSSIRTSIVGEFMESYYQDAIYETGSGSDQRRKSHIRRGFSDEELFSSVLDGISETFTELANDLHDELNSLVEGHLDRVKGALEILQTDNAAREGDENPGFRMAVRDCVERAREDMERVVSLIEDDDEEEDEDDE